MNAPVNLNQTTIQPLATASGLALDKKRYWWLLSPGLPVIGMGILAGYQFGPKATKKIFALGGPLLLHVIIPMVDALVGDDSNNPDDEEIVIKNNLQRDSLRKKRALRVELAQDSLKN